MKRNDLHDKDNLKKVTGEYLYYKGVIRGLEEAMGKSEVEIKSLIAIYSVQTKSIDKMLEEKRLTANAS